MLEQEQHNNKCPRADDATTNALFGDSVKVHSSRKDESPDGAHNCNSEIDRKAAESARRANPNFNLQTNWNSRAEFRSLNHLPRQEVDFSLSIFPPKKA